MSSTIVTRGIVCGFLSVVGVAKADDTSKLLRMMGARGRDVSSGYFELEVETKVDTRPGSYPGMKETYHVWFEDGRWRENVYRDMPNGSRARTSRVVNEDAVIFAHFTGDRRINETKRGDQSREDIGLLDPRLVGVAALPTGAFRTASLATVYPFGVGRVDPSLTPRTNWIERPRHAYRLQFPEAPQKVQDELERKKASLLLETTDLPSGDARIEAVALVVGDSGDGEFTRAVFENQTALWPRSVEFEQHLGGQLVVRETTTFLEIDDLNEDIDDEIFQLPALVDEDFDEVYLSDDTLVASRDGDLVNYQEAIIKSTQDEVGATEGRRPTSPAVRYAINAIGILALSGLLFYTFRRTR